MEDGFDPTVTFGSSKIPFIVFGASGLDSKEGLIPKHYAGCNDGDLTAAA